MERDRAHYFAQKAGNALLVVAAVILVIGVIVIIALWNDVDQRFNFQSGSARVEDYLWVLWPLTTALLTVVGVIGGLGLYFRWLALEQDARMSEFDALLGALGVPFEDEADDVPQEPAPNA